jgi:hypothetical protein
MSYQPDWDHDLREGQHAEKLVIDLLTDDQIEVKYDRKALITGNLYIETHCRRRDGWNESGINTTKATVWFFVLDMRDKKMMSLTTTALKEAIQDPQLPRKEMTEGSHPTKGILLPLRTYYAPQQPRQTISYSPPPERDSTSWLTGKLPF